MRSNDLRTQILGLLQGLEETYSLNEVAYKHVNDEDMYPHITFEILNVDVRDLNRKDYIVDIDIYTRDSQELALDIGDAVEDMLNALNDPESTILPTYYLVTRQSLEDTDKRIKHEAIRVEVQLYEP